MEEAGAGSTASGEGLVHQTYDIFQPDCRTVGGILIRRKVGVRCERFISLALVTAPMASRCPSPLQETNAQLVCFLETLTANAVVCLEHHF